MALVNKMELKTVMLGGMYDIGVKYAIDDNARENEDVKRACKQERMGVQFEYIVPGIPQQNSHVELNGYSLL